jgi:aspartyl-tRNA(Asn)/glutamyl-tRNA(Gln) amidotransferase subunit A
MCHDQFLSLESGVGYEFQDARDLDGPHAGLALTAGSRALLRRLAGTSDHAAPAAVPAPVTDLPAAGRKNVKVRQLLDRLAREGDPLHALVHVDPDCDLRSAEGGALDGMILAIKDNAHVAGMPTGFGADPFFAEHATGDAPVVARLRAAGGIILGKANMMEFAYGAAHPLRLETRNPCDAARSAGGSSGGTAAAVAVGLADGGFGTDTAGSIRQPASYCGIVGFKPSHGKVPMQGVLPLSPTLDVGGLMARDVATVARLFAVMAARETVLPEHVRCSFLVLDDYVGDANVSDEVRQAFEQGLMLLSAAGHDIRRLPPGRLHPPMGVVENGLMIMGPEAAIVLEGFEARAPERLTTATRAQIAEGFAMPASWYLRAMAFRLALSSAFEALLQGVDALLLPTTHAVAPRDAAQVGSSDDLAQMLMTIPFNITGQPAISVPLPVGPGWMPVGLQIVGRKDTDDALLGVALAAERAFARG